MFDFCRKVFLSLAYFVSIVGSVAYCFYLIWLLAYVKDSGYYWFFSFIPGIVLLGLLSAAVSQEQGVDYVLLPLFDVLLMLMCSFTMLTRKAYYHLSADDLIGSRWVIMSLKGSIVFFVCGFLAEKECLMKKILEDKDILSRSLLDFVDIFNVVELLSLNQCVGIGSSVTEGSDLEMTIQAFCTMSIIIILYVIDPLKHLNELGGRSDDPIEDSAIYMSSAGFQNIPFLIIRIIVWARYNVFSLGFMVKNFLAIVVFCGQLPNVCRESNEEANDRSTEPV